MGNKGDPEPVKAALLEQPALCADRLKASRGREDEGMAGRQNGQTW